MWHQINENLNDIFSINQFMELLGLDKKQTKDKREARNILNQLYKSKKIYRISNNIYKKRKD